MTRAHWGGGTTYAVRPTAYDAGGAGTAAPPLSVLVRDLPAVLTVAGVPAEAVGQPTPVSATFTDPGTSETHAGLIDWGDGTTSAAAITESNGTGTVAAAHAYAAHGSYTAMLIVTDSGGAVAMASVPVTVGYVAPAVSIVAPSTPAALGQPTTLTLHDGGPEAASAVTAWGVDFGDGTVVSVTTPPDAAGNWTVTHAYAAAGTYQVHATATDAAGVHDAGTATVTVADAPSNLTATALNDNAVQLDWDPDPTGTAIGFAVQRQAAGGTWATLATVDDTTAGDTYLDENLSGATAYAYRVMAVDPTNGDATPFAGPAAVTTPLTTPPVPRGLAATESAAGEVDLAWHEDTTVGTGFVVTATPAGGGAPLTLAVAGDLESLAVTGLTPGAAYAFAVAADNDQGNGHDAKSATCDPVTAVAPGGALTATAPATVDEGASITLTLASSPPTGVPPITSWAAAWDDGTTTDVVSGPGGTVQHTPPTGSLGVTATVTATDAAGHTFVLPPVSVNVAPLAPTGVTATAVSAAEVDVGWVAASAAFSGYAVLRSDDGATTFDEVGQVDATASTFADATVAPASTPVYEVLAVGGTAGATNGPSVRVGTATATVPSDVPILSVDAGTPAWSSAVVTWRYAGHLAGLGELEMRDVSAGQNFYYQQDLLFQGGAITGQATIDVVPGDTYEFRARADNDNGQASVYGNVVQYAAPILAAPVVTNVGRATLTIAFQPGTAARYDVDSRGWSDPGPAWRPFNPSHYYPYCYNALGPSGGTISGFWENGEPEYRVRAIAASGEPSAWSDPFKAPAPDASDVPTPTVAVTPTSDSQVNVTVTGGVTDPAGGSWGYRVYLADPTSGRTVQAQGGNGATATATFAFAGLAAGTRYYATAVSDEEFPSDDDPTFSNFADEKSATTLGGVAPRTPTGLVATPAPHGNTPAYRRVFLHWHNSPDNEDQYQIRISWDSGFTWFPNPPEPAGPTGMDVTAAEAHVDYNHYIYFEVKAIRNGVASGWSLPAGISPGPIIVGFYGADTAWTYPNGKPGNDFDGENLPTSDREMNRIYSILTDAGYESRFFQAVTGLRPAETWLFQTLDTGMIKDQKYDPGNTDSMLRDVARSIKIFGYSWGGTTGIKLAKDIQNSSHFVGLGKTVQTLITVDPVTLFLNAPPFDLPGPIIVPSNVSFYYDWWQANPDGGGGVHLEDQGLINKVLNLAPKLLGVYTIEGKYMASLAYRSEYHDLSAIGGIDHLNIVPRVEQDVIFELTGHQIYDYGQYLSGVFPF